MTVRTVTSQNFPFCQAPILQNLHHLPLGMGQKSSARAQLSPTINIDIGEDAHVHKRKFLLQNGSIVRTKILLLGTRRSAMHD